MSKHVCHERHGTDACQSMYAMKGIKRMRVSKKVRHGRRVCVCVKERMRVSKNAMEGVKWMCVCVCVCPKRYAMEGRNKCVSKWVRLKRSLIQRCNGVTLLVIKSKAGLGETLAHFS